MQRTPITLDDDLMSRLDEFMSDRRYANRSEAIRDLVRAGYRRLNTRRPGPKAEGVETVLADLRREFADANRRLAERYGLDVAHWLPEGR